MGSQQSRVRIKIPNQIRCFPSFLHEWDILETVKKIEECHQQAVKIASWVGAAMATAPFPVGGPLLFPAATALFTFLLHRLTGSSSAKICEKDTQGKGKSNFNNNNGDKQEVPKDTTLEDALIDSKVSAAIAKKSVCELQAKLCIINNRYHRMLSDISLEDRRLEVVPGIQTCEEVLRLFYDPNHVFRMNPLVTSPFLITFAGIFVSLAELSLVLIPSYKEPLVGEMHLLCITLNSYKEACIKTRMDGIKFRNVQPGSMLDVVAGGMMAETNYTMEDACLNRANAAQNQNNGGGFSGGPPVENDDDGMENVFHDANEAVTTYRNELDEHYTRFFATALDTIAKFSAFENNTCEVEVDVGVEVEIACSTEACGQGTRGNTLAANQ